MKIFSHNPGHDGAIAYIQDNHLIMSAEAEKDSNARHATLSITEAFRAAGELDEIPDVVCTGGWWPRDHYEYLNGSDVNAGYRGVSRGAAIIGSQRLFGKSVRFFSSSHERSHILCAFGMSEIEMGQPCYALIWEGALGSFYEIDTDLNIASLGEILSSPGNRYGLLYGLADPTFPKNGPFPRVEDPGKLMALASFADRAEPTAAEKKLLEFLLQGPFRPLNAYEDIDRAPHLNVGVTDQEFCNFAGIYSNAIFDMFYSFARANLKRDLPLIVAGGCGLNCDWNTKWRECGLFSDVFVPPVANDSGAAIGTALDAQFYFTGDAKMKWSVYSGYEFKDEPIDAVAYDIREATPDLVADLLSQDLILGWATGRYEIGPRALGNRSILAAPFRDSTRKRLNEIKEREQFRPIAPVCLEEEAARWFSCNEPSPFMLYTYRVTTDALAAVTHVNRTARLQTVSQGSNRALYELLVAFKARTGFGVLCNTSLNFKGRGFINRTRDLSAYTIEHKLDGFVAAGRVYILKDSATYRAYAEKAS